jgi:hypothetical protein
MVYHSEVALLTELEYEYPRVQTYHSEEAEQAQQEVVDLLEESRGIAVARSASYQQMLQRYHTQRVHTRAF